MLTLFAIATILLNSTPRLTVQDQGMSLEKADRITNMATGWHRDSFTAGDKVFHFALESHYVDDTRVASVTFDLHKQYGRLTGTVAIPDDRNWQRGGCKIFVDGDLVSQSPVTKAHPVKDIEVDLTKGGTLRIEFASCYLAEPLLFAGSPSEPGVSPRLIEPANKAVVSGKSVSLSWAKVEGAIAYGVEVVSTSLDDDDSGSDRMQCFTVRGQTALDLDLTKLPNGRYHWSVIAFGTKKSLGGFSEERSIFLKH